MPIPAPLDPATEYARRLAARRAISAARLALFMVASLMAHSAGFVMIALGLAVIARAFFSVQVHLYHLPALAGF